jgi:hypothetical protein
VCAGAPKFAINFAHLNSIKDRLRLVPDLQLFARLCETSRAV